jgi:Membrane bound FAD containing D-sorbitol dehydrogenase
MSDLPPGPQNLIAQNAKVRVTIGYTRRTVLAGAAAVTAAATVGTVNTTVPARAADPNSAQDMTDFVTLSAALTGILEPKLAPGSDPIDIKRDYFKWLNEKRPAAFEKLLNIVRENRSASNPAQVIVEKVQSDPESKFLARSIVLMWYLGAWYDPDHLKALAESSAPPPEAFSYNVISSKAYAQGWVWRVAQAHPMGYSDMQFGYWQRKPNPEHPDFFIGGA